MMSNGLSYGDTDSVRDINSISALDTASLPRHRWYHLKEAFSPNIVARAIEDSKCGQDDLILDPFSGSGTVPLASALNGMNAIGLEVNPFLAFVSKTKLQHCEPNTLDRNLKRIISGIQEEAQSSLETFSTFSKPGGAKKWLFNQEVLRAFEGGWRATVSMYRPVRSIIRLCLIGAAMDVCNATKDGKCLRYRRDWETLDFGKKHFIDSLNRRTTEIKKDLKETPLRAPEASIYLADSRSMVRSNILSEKFKLCITSPPYLNSFDYTDVYRPELFLGKFVQSMKELRALRQRTIRSHVQAKWVDPKETDFGHNFAECFAEIEKHIDSLWNKRIPAMIRAYFEDMRNVLVGLKRYAKTDASVWIVVSTSAYAGVEIPVDLIIAEVGTQAGWHLREVSVMRYLRRVPVQQWDELSKRSQEQEQRKGPYLRESIVILDAKPHGK